MTTLRDSLVRDKSAGGFVKESARKIFATCHSDVLRDKNLSYSLECARQRIVCSKWVTIASHGETRIPNDDSNNTSRDMQSSDCTHNSCAKIVLTATGRCPKTSDSLLQFCRTNIGHVVSR